MKPSVEMLEDRNLPSSWTALGPAAINNSWQLQEASGRIAALAADPTDPNTIYIAAAGGGVWKTSNANSASPSWIPLTDSQSTLFMGSIAIAPGGGESSRVIYAGTGEANFSAHDTFYGRGVLVSKDSGNTWTLTGNKDFNRSAIGSIVIDPTDPTGNTAYAAVSGEPNNGLDDGFGGGNYGIWKTTNGGTTWNNTTAGIVNQAGVNPFTSLIISPNSTANHVVLYAAVGEIHGGVGYNGVYVTTNGGGNWAALTNIFPGQGTNTLGRISLAISGNSATLYASVQDPSTAMADPDEQGTLEIEKSTNGGNTWNPVMTENSSNYINYMGTQGAYDQTLICDPSDPTGNIVYAAGQFNPNNYPFQGFIKTTNGGTTWTDISTGTNGEGPHVDHHGIGFDSNGKLLDGDDGGIWRLDNTTVGSIQWTDLNGNLNITEFTGTALDPVNANIVYGGSQDNGTEKYTGSTAWNSVFGGDGGTVRVDPNNHNTVYTETAYSTTNAWLFRSPDGGSNWAGISNGIAGAVPYLYAPYVLDPDNTNRIVLGTTDVNESINDGTSWRIIGMPNTAGFDPQPDISGNTSVTAVAALGNMVYAATSDGQVWASTNDGLSWTTHNPIPVTAFDGGPTVAGGGPFLPGGYQDLEIDTGDPSGNTAYIVTAQFEEDISGTAASPHLVFETTNGGVTWTDISAGLPDLPTWSIAIDHADHTLFVGTDNGVYVSSNLAGGTWSVLDTGIPNGMPNVQVTSLEYIPNLHVLAAGTHGRGMWEFPVVAITTSTLSNWTVNQAGYLQTITATGGFGTLTFSHPGALPPGLSLSSNGILSGIPTTAGGYSITVTATDSLGINASQTYLISINQPVTITTTALANWTANTPGYNQTINTNFGTAPLTFTISGTLPVGLTLNSRGVISGTPTTAAAYSFTVTVTDAAGSSSMKTYTVTINPPVSITTTALPAWTSGKAYSQSITATGGTGAVTFNASSLPAGLTLSSAGVLSGTPTTAGTYMFMVTAKDSVGATATKMYTVTINAAVTITSTALPAWTSGKAYSQSITVTGGTGAVTFTAPASSLPTGLTLSSAGLLSGTPTTAASYTFTVTATDSVGATGTRSFTVMINPVIAITTTALASWTVSQAGYSQTIAATGGTGALTFTKSGTLPPGMVLSSAGVISGTPTTSGTFSMTIVATDTVGANAMQSSTITVNPLPTISGTLPNWTANHAGYSQNVVVLGGTGPFTYATTAGTLPTGLTLSSGGLLSGTPTTPGSFTFTVKVTDTAGATASNSFTVTINAALSITTASLSYWTLNQSGYSQTVAAMGGTGTLTFSKTGTLPTGLTLNASTGAISGTPTAAGSYSFTVTVTDSTNASTSQSYMVTINAAIAITTITLPTADANVHYSQTIATTGGTGPYTFSTTSGTIPTGLMLASATGVLFGMPTTAGTFTFTITDTDSTSASASQIYTVVINPAVTITTATLLDWTVATAGYNQTVSAAGGNGPYSFTQSAGTLPTGVTMNSNGVLSGTPTTAGSYAFTVTATDSLGGSSSQPYTITINPAITLTPGSLPAGYFDPTGKKPYGYNQIVAASGGTGSVTLSVSNIANAIPGLNLPSSGTGTLGITGMPSESAPVPVTETFTVTATDAVGATTPMNYSITALPTAYLSLPDSGYQLTAGSTAPMNSLPISINELQDQAGNLGLAQATLVVSFPMGVFNFPVGGNRASADVSLGAFLASPAGGGAGNWSLSANSPSDGQLIVTLGANSNITTNTGGGSLVTIYFPIASNPTSPISEAITLASATNLVAGNIGGGNYVQNPAPPFTSNITFNPPVSISTTSLPDATAGTAYIQTITAAGGTGSLTFSSTGTLPASFSLSRTGVLSSSGLPQVAGSYTFTVTATDSNGASASQTYSIMVNPGPFNKYVVGIPGGNMVQAGRGFLITVQAADQYGNSISSYSGPASVNITVTPNDPANSYPSSLAINSFGQGLFLATMPKVGSYSFSVADSTNTYTGSFAPVDVIPAVPVKIAFVAQPVNTPTGVTLPAVTVQLEDSYGNAVTTDNSDAVTLSIASGPGSFTSDSTTTVTFHNGLATFANLRLAVPGVYSFSELVPALYIGPNSAFFAIAPLQVVPGSFQSNNQGFSLQFNAPIVFNWTTPILYGSGFYGHSGFTSIPSLIVTSDPSNPADYSAYVPGTLIIHNTTNYSITFVATDTSMIGNGGSMLLADGTYGVILHSSSSTDGFQAFYSGGGFLDGTNSGTPGHDFTTTFTVAAAASGDDVVWVPATADGPGQALEGPGDNQMGGGYPIYLSDTTGNVTSVSATLTYDPSLLTITSGPGSPGLMVTVTAPGTAQLSYNGQALPKGTQTPIGYIGWSGPDPLPVLATTGTLPAATYYYVITVLDGTSESMPGLQSSPITTGGSYVGVLVGFEQGILATGYNIYRSTSPTGPFGLLSSTTVTKDSNGNLIFTPHSGFSSSDNYTIHFTDDNSFFPGANTPPSTLSTAIVPSGTAANPMPYRAKDLLQLSNIMLNGGAIAALAADAVHLVAYVGDADGNGSYSSNDAVLLTRVGLQEDTGFTAYGLVDPVIVGDMDGSYFIPADAALQANEAGVGVLTTNLPNPPIPSGVDFATLTTPYD